MQVSVETTSALERRVTIQVPAEQVDTAVEARLKDTARKAKVDGYRPGKVPMSVIKRRFGEGVRQDVLSELMRSNFIEAVTQEKLNPAGTPEIEPGAANEAGKPFEFTATFEVYPEIELKSLEGETVERPVAEINDQDLEDLIVDLRKQRAEWADADKAAETGDQVNIDFEGFIDGEAFEGGKGESYDLVLGSSSFIPGFEDQLVGSKAGEDKEVEVSFPEDYQAANLAGKAATFKCKVNAVKAQELPELNEEFFTQFGVSEGGEEAFRKEVRKNMGAQLKQALRNTTKQAVFEALMKANPIEVPGALVENEVDNLRRQAAQQYNLGEDFDISQIPGDLFQDQAKNNVVLGLLVGEVIKANEIKADQTIVDELLNEMAQSYQEPQKVVDYYKTNPEMLRQVEGAALEQQVVEKLLAEAEVTDVTKTFKELAMPAQQ
ncbi:trigger factor, partial [Marinospirillum insulare]|uniref:Trigger factor n=1 Tax=Marinospirillum insulare TaxID=217169 RepID=A0ABQ5ZXJ4_9GAMM